ncbi:MAG: ornithine carbamoyltransferase [Candidatus Altiarchaeota archaeon]
MHLLSISDFSAGDVDSLLGETAKLKSNPEKYSESLKGKTLAIFFEKPSTRTRISFDVAIYQLGGHGLTLRPNEMQLGRGETIADSARVLSRYVDGVMARVNKQETLVELASHSTIPIINGLSDIEHPCQALSDLFTIKESAGKLEGVKLSYVGDGNNVANSLLLACALTGVEFTCATPMGYEPNEKIYKKAKKISSKINLSNDPIKAVKDADFIYTDVWVSMGDESEEKKRMKDLEDFQVNKKLLSKAGKNCKVLHCLPAHRGQEITDEVIDSPASLVWDQAENRLHMQKAILVKLMGQ